jgi:hypothetical protein
MVCSRRSASVNMKRTELHEQEIKISKAQRKWK